MEDVVDAVEDVANNAKAAIESVMDTASAYASITNIITSCSSSVQLDGSIITELDDELEPLAGASDLSDNDLSSMSAIIDSIKTTLENGVNCLSGLNLDRSLGLKGDRSFGIEAYSLSLTAGGCKWFTIWIFLSRTKIKRKSGFFML